MQPKFSLAEPHDLPTLNRISVASKRHWGYPDEWIRLWADDLRVSLADLTQQSVYKLSLAEETIGFCAIEKHPDQFEINHLWILPDQIRNGFGKLLLHAALNKTVDHPARIVVTSDPNAENFYAAQGFVTVDHVESLPKGRFLPVMHKRHTPSTNE